MNGWCDKCGGVQPQCGQVLVPIRETKPHYQVSFHWFAACPERHAMRHLCVACKTVPSADGIDYCLTCWPEDGGPFVTLPLVYTAHPDRHGHNLAE